MLAGFVQSVLSVRMPLTASMRAGDGCRLDATVWRPEGDERYPVLLMRQPYGRAIASTVVFAHPAWYSAHGYVVVVQDVRGTGTSEGEFLLFAHDETDGAETIAWAATLEGSNGRVGMYGFSYQANTQYLALAGWAQTGAGTIGALAPAMGGWNVRSDWAYENGAFRLGPNLGWALQMGFVKATHDGDRLAAQALRSAAAAPPVQEANRTRPDIIRRFGHWTHYEAWLTHPDADAYWERFAPASRLAGHPLDVPMLHVGGWYDQTLMGTLAGHQAVVRAGRAEQALWVGPWTHQPWGRRVGAVDFGAGAASPIDPAQVAWFDRHLKGRDGPSLGGLRLFDLGARIWRRFAEWPETHAWTLFLGGDGRAGSASSGVLAAGGATAGADRIVHDPWRPAPAMGGHGSAPAGMQDRAGVDDRADVAVYTSRPVDRPVFLCGAVSAVLTAEADQPSFDIDAVLSMVAPDGRAWTLTQGHVRCDDAPDVAAVPMRAVCVTVPAGHALRLSLAGAAFPSYAVNPGSGAPATDFTSADERVITIAIRHGASRLVLPEVV